MTIPPKPPFPSDAAADDAAQQLADDAARAAGVEPGSAAHVGAKIAERMKRAKRGGGE